MKPLTNKHQKSYQNAKVSYICKEKSKNKHVKDKKYCKILWDHCIPTGEYKGTAHSIII